MTETIDRATIDSATIDSTTGNAGTSHWSASTENISTESAVAPDAVAEETMGEDSLPAPFRPRPVTISRRYPNAPMVGTGVSIFDEAGRVLLVKSGKPGRKHPWGLPGGLLDLGEALADGARREVWEECQVEIDLGEMIHVFEPIDWDAEGNVEYHFVVVDFWASWRSGTPTPGDDTVEVAWCALEDLAAYNLMEFSKTVIAKGHAAWRAARHAESIAAL